VNTNTSCWSTSTKTSVSGRDKLTPSPVLHPGDSPGQVSGGAAILIALIWIVISVVNLAYAHQRWCQRRLGQRYLWRPAAGCSVRS